VRQKDASIRAPYDGVVTAKKVDVGDLAAPGVPLLSLQKQAANEVVFEVPEKYIPAIYLQQKVTVNIPSLQEKMLPAVVVRIDPSADQKSRSFRIRAELPHDKSIRSGMYAKVEMPVGETASMVIPATAVVHQGQLMGIYLVDEHQVARFRLIRTGKAFGDNVEVVSGLKDGDRYVVIPPPELSDGTKVEMTS
jgi:RND family efflux transporter MFP subunit